MTDPQVCLRKKELEYETRLDLQANLYYAVQFLARNAGRREEKFSPIVNLSIWTFSVLM